MDANIVENWLRSLNMVQYTQSFLDNGYDDLEICKQIGAEDLDAIGVLRVDHRDEVLAAVQHLREHGGTAVYFTLDPEYQRVNGLGPYTGASRGLHYVQRSLDHDHNIVTNGRTCHGGFSESGPHGSGDNYTIPAATTSPSRCPVHSNYVENSVLGNISPVCVVNGYNGGGVAQTTIGSPCAGGGGGSQPSSGNVTPAWLSPTHRPLTVPVPLSNGLLQGGSSSIPLSPHPHQPPLPPPPPPPPPPPLPPLGGFPSIHSGRVGVPLPLPPCQACLGEDVGFNSTMTPCGSCPGGRNVSHPVHPHLDGQQTLVTFTRLQLMAIVRDKLEADSIVLTEEKYLNKSDSSQNLELLSFKYAEDLNTHSQDVFLRLLEIQESYITSNGHDSSPERDSENGEIEPCRMFSVYGQANRSVPPPLPSCPPPSTLYEDPDCLSVLKRESPSHSSRSPLLPPARQNSEEGPIEYPLGEIDLRKKGLTLGRLFRKKPPRKYVYKQYEGDLNASEITMPDEERIELMLLVKEGRLSMHEAVEKVKRYEKQKRDELLREKERDGDKRPC